MAQRVSYRDTGFEYVKGSEKVLFSNGVCLTVSEYAQLDRQNAVIREILQRAKNGAQLYDFDYAVKEGVLRELQRIPERPNTASPRPTLRPAPKREKFEVPQSTVKEAEENEQGWKEYIANKAIGRNLTETERAIADDFVDKLFKSAPELEETSTLSAEEIDALLTAATGDDPLPELSVEPEPSVVEAPVESVPLPIDTPVEGISTQPAAPVPYWRTVPFIVELAMALVAGGAAVQSCYHTTSFLLMSGKPLWTSFITGFIMIVFSATAFTAARFFLQERGATKLFSVIFVVMGTFIIAYSMFSTLTVNFNMYSWEEQEEMAELVENSTELAVANEQKELLYVEIKRLDEEIARLETEADGWRNQSWRVWEQVSARLDSARSQRQMVWDNYVAAGSDWITAESVVNENRGTIYGFITELFGLPEDIIRFIILVIPALFFDAIAPMGVTVVLYIAQRRRNEK